MLAISIPEAGGPEVLTATEISIPEPGPHQVLIKIAAAGINRPDIMQRQGLYPPPAGASPVPGLEIAGEICAKGSEVKTWRIGDQVCALVNGGGYAEYCLAYAGCCLPIPKGLSPAQAASLPETFFTVWHNLFERAKLQKGESLLIHGGGSGIGVCAIQIARCFGVNCLTTVGSDHKAQRCIELGANLAINYREQDFVAAIKLFTQNHGVDVILDMIGGDYFAKNIACLADEGRLIQIAIMHGPKSEINLLPFMLKRLALTGSTLRSRSDQFKANIAQALLENIWPLLEKGQIKTIIDKCFPLDQVAEAHRYLESSQHFGKIILELSPTCHTVL